MRLQAVSETCDRSGYLARIKSKATHTTPMTTANANNSKPIRSAPQDLHSTARCIRKSMCQIAKPRQGGSPGFLMSPATHSGDRKQRDTTGGMSKNIQHSTTGKPAIVSVEPVWLWPWN